MPIKSLVFTTIAACIGWLISSLSAPFSVAADYGERAFAYFRPDAATSLALDSLGHSSTAQPIERSRFRSFISRALAHARFSAGQFNAHPAPA